MGARITVLPIIRTSAERQDLIARMAWAIGFAPFRDVVIFVATPDLAAGEWRVPESMDPAIAGRFESLRPRVSFVVAPSREEIIERVVLSDGVVAVAAPDRDMGGDAELLSAAMAGREVFWCDPEKTRQEFGNWLELNARLREDTAQNEAISRERFAAFAERCANRPLAYCLATGPSLARFREINFDGALTIVCNSAILDEELMDRARPDALVFADPIFQFGPSRYAAAFRSALRASCGRHEYAIIVPQKFHGALIDAMPELRPRIMGIPVAAEGRINLNLRDDFCVGGTGNILTFLMLPLVSTLASKVRVMGCDGRPVDQDDYFWRHNESTQINDKMANIREVHPAFFAIDYNDYYLDHCRHLEAMLAQGETSGVEYRSVTPSHIPALARRPLVETAGTGPAPIAPKGPKEMVRRTRVVAPFSVAHGKSMIRALKHLDIRERLRRFWNRTRIVTDSSSAPGPGTRP